MFCEKDLNFIKKAQKNCKRLIIGVYTDDIAKIINGKMPVISCEDRKKIVYAIKGVDDVIEIDDIIQLENKEEKLKRIKKEKYTPEIDIEIQQKKYQIGFIQGTFDMFHSGHLNLIMRAKAQCEKLIVGVNSDDLVKEYKNKVPIINFEERLKIVEAIKRRR